VSLWRTFVRWEHALERFVGLHPPPDPADEDAPTEATRAASPAAPMVLAGGVSPASSPPVVGAASNDDPIVGPAYSYLTRADLGWGPEARRALLDAQRAVGLDPKIGGLLAVIQHESGGDPAAPRVAQGTPRGGLIQVTAGANLPGYRTPAAVWAIRSMSAAEQLRSVVLDYLHQQFPRGATVQDGTALLRRNFLPGLASQPSGYVLGVRPEERDAEGKIVREAGKGPGGEDATDRIAGSLSRGAIYRANAGFDPSGRGYFTWADVDGQAVRSVDAGKKAGGWLTVSGRLVPFSSGAAPVDRPLSGATPPRGDAHALLNAWRAGETDPLRWEPLMLPGGIRALTTGEPLSVGGLPRVLPYADLVQIAAEAGAIPLTPPISDARWAQATDRRIVSPVPSPDGAHYNDPAQNAAFLAMRGPILGTGLRDGDHKEMVLIEGDPDPPKNRGKMQPRGPNSMVFYGWRKPDGSTWQKGIRSDHDRDWIEYDSLGNLVARYATDSAGNVVDLLELVAGGRAGLGGPLAPWQVDELRGALGLAPPRTRYGASSGPMLALERGTSTLGGG